MSGRTFVCEECGFDAAAVSDEGLVAACASFVRRFRPPLTRFLPGEDGAAVIRRRPAPEVWSALEYAAHTRGVLAFYRERIELVLTEDRPTMRGVDAEQRAQEEARYHDEDPVAVADGIAAEASRLAELLGGLDDAGWARVGLSSEGTGAERTVRVLAERVVHDAQHHLLDIGRSLRAARADRSG